MNSLLLKNCIIYTPTPLPGLNDLLIINGKINKIAGSIKPFKNLKVIDCRGKIVAPGFLDIHSQGAGGADVITGTKEALDTVSLTLAKTGVTSFLATTVVVPDKDQKHLKTVSLVIKQGLPGADILGIHLEGPFVNVKKKGMIQKCSIRKPDLKFLHKLVEVSNSTIKMMTIAPEIPGTLKIIKKLRKYRIIASIGHTLATYEQAIKWIKCGITHVTHLFNAMPPLMHRAPGTIGAIFDNKIVTAQVISDGVHILPPVLRIIYKLLGKDRIVLITDSMPSLGLKDGVYKYFGIEYSSRRGTCYYKDGTLIGTSLPLNEMAFRMMKFIGAPFEEVLQMVTLNPAKTLRLSSKGVIKVGIDADIIVTDKKFKIYKTMVRAKII